MFSSCEFCLCKVKCQLLIWGEGIACNATGASYGYKAIKGLLFDYDVCGIFKQTATVPSVTRTIYFM